MAAEVTPSERVALRQKLSKSKLSRLGEFSPRAGVDSPSSQNSNASLEEASDPDLTADASSIAPSSLHRSESRRRKHKTRSASSSKVHDLEVIVEQLKTRTVQLEWLLQQNGTGMSKDATVESAAHEEHVPLFSSSRALWHKEDAPHDRHEKDTPEANGAEEAAPATTTTRTSGRRRSLDAMYADVKEIMETADKADLANLYSYTIEESLARPMSIGTVLRVIFLFALSGVQVIFAYGFYDASRLLARQRGYPAYRDPVDMSLMYPTSLVGSFNKIPIINFLSSLVSLVLLALLMKNDTEGTLLTTCPMEILCLPRSKFDKRPDPPRSLVYWTVQTLNCTLLMVAWCCRALLLPILGGLGTAQAFAGSSSAQDIVLNSVAIGFVYELDDVLYQTLLPERTRKAYEQKPPLATSPLSDFVPNGQMVVTLYTWLAFIVDVGVSLYAYNLFAFDPPTNLHYHNYELTRPYFFMRTGALALAYLHLAFTSHRRGPKWQVGLGALALVVLIFAFAALTLGPAFAAGLDASLGADPSIAVANQPVHDCMWGISNDIVQNGHTVSCSLAHKRPPDYLYQVLREQQIQAHGVDPMVLLERAFNSDKATHHQTFTQFVHPSQSGGHGQNASGSSAGHSGTPTRVVHGR